MSSIRNLFVLALSIALIAIAHPEAAPGPSSRETIFDFQELLNALPAESLHVALHKHANDKYQDGIYEHDRIAVAKVRDVDPGTATKVLAEAALHLLKRQNSGNETTTAATVTARSTPTTASTTTSVLITSTTATGDDRTQSTQPKVTTTSVPTTTTSIIQSSTPTTTSATQVVVPISVETTNALGSTSTLVTSAVVSATASIISVMTITNSIGSSVVTTTTAPAAIVTLANGQISTSVVPVFSNPTAKGSVAVTRTSTNAQGSTFVTTFTPGGGSVSSLVLITTTLPDGVATTITSFAPLAAATFPASTTGPRLQNGANALNRCQTSAQVAALIMGAAMLLLQ